MPHRNRKRKADRDPDNSSTTYFPRKKDYPTTVDENGKELVQYNQLPEQLPVDPGAINPFTYVEKQARIYIFGFSLDNDLGSFMSEEAFKEGVHRFTCCYNFFTSKASKAKRNRGQSSVIPTQVHRYLIPFGARAAVLIRPVIFPDTNLHTIQQLINEKFFSTTISLWLFDHQLEKFSTDKSDLELAIKVLKYEHYRNKNLEWNENLPKFRTVDEYRTNIGNVVLGFGVNFFV